ncbi:MAG: Npt1/Npt2 family nucleotide transporter [Acidobacteriota bacterium]
MNGQGRQANQPEQQKSDAAVTVAMLVAAAMIANHVGGRATRDALFFSNFDITALPLMLIGASLFSIATVVFFSRAMPRLSPQRLVPWGFGTSAVLLLAEWGLISLSPRVAAVAVYLHLAVVGAFLISGFWSMINERFDPRTAKKRISRIAGAATVGGLAGGIVAERVAALLSVSTMLPLLALMHFFCAWRLGALRPLPGSVSPRADRHPVSDLKSSAFRIVAQESYLRSLAVLVLLGTLSAALIDYVFKAQAVATFQQGEELLRFFAIFYMVIGLLTFVLQTALGRVSLEKLGLAKTVATLPSAVVVGALGVLFAPGLASAAIARAGEAVLRSSLFRSAYELFYTPVSVREKRATKSLIDVGFQRLGDALGGGTVRLILFLGPQIAHSTMLISAALIAGVALVVARNLHQGYIGALEKSLLNRAVELDLSEVADKTTRQIMVQTMGSLELRALGLQDAKSVSSQELADPEKELLRVESEASSASLDPIVQQIVHLRSGKPQQIRATLAQAKILEPPLVPHVIPLLAWDEVCREAIRALRKAAPVIKGQLVDVLVDPQQDFAIRRRIPRVLSAAPTQRAVAGLWNGLKDTRFEVRFQCGRALANILDRNSEIQLDKEKVFSAVLREVAVGRRVWESQRLLDQLEDDEENSLLVDEFLKKRSSRSLEHVFTILSLALPKEPLKIAFRGLHTDNRDLKGTALEYLESILPEAIRKSLWPFLEDDRKAKRERTQSREEILAELMHSNQSIELNLAEIIKKSN